MVGEIYFCGIDADERFFETVSRMWVIGRKTKPVLLYACVKEPDYDEAKR